MKWIVPVFFLAYIATSLSVNIDLSSPWEHYKKVFKKNYSQEEEERRHLIWENNAVTILLHNLDYDFGLETFYMGLNDYSDMTHEEFLTTMNDLSDGSDVAPENTFEPPSDFEVPTTVNWLAEGYVTEAENQGLCGGSWAHSAAGALEGQLKKNSGNLVPLSKQNLIDCIAPSSDNSDGCTSRGSVHKAFEYVKNNGGINTKQCYPSEEVRGNCEYNSSCIGATCTGYINIESGNEDHLKNAVAYVGPISVNIDASSSKFQFFRCGTFQDSSCSSTELNHAALLIGYGHNYGHDYWLLKNSWGTKWGCRDGLFKILRNKNNHCGIATEALYPFQQ